MHSGGSADEGALKPLDKDRAYSFIRLLPVTGRLQNKRTEDDLRGKTIRGSNGLLRANTRAPQEIIGTSAVLRIETWLTSHDLLAITRYSPRSDELHATTPAAPLLQQRWS